MTDRLAISVESFNGLDSVLEPRFGRAFGYVVVDITSDELVAELENTQRDAAHGAGTGAAALLSRNKVDAVVSGRFGPKAAQALDSLGIDMYAAPDGLDVKKITALFLSGALERELGTAEMGSAGQGQQQGQGNRGGGNRGGMGGGGGGGGGSGVGGRGRGCGMGGGKGGGGRNRAGRGGGRNRGK